MLHIRYYHAAILCACHISSHISLFRFYFYDFKSYSYLISTLRIRSPIILCCYVYCRLSTLTWSMSLAASAATMTDSAGNDIVHHHYHHHHHHQLTTVAHWCHRRLSRYGQHISIGYARGCDITMVSSISESLIRPLQLIIYEYYRDDTCDTSVVPLASINICNYLVYACKNGSVIKRLLRVGISIPTYRFLCTMNELMGHGYVGIGAQILLFANSWSSLVPCVATHSTTITTTTIIIIIISGSSPIISRVVSAEVGSVHMGCVYHWTCWHTIYNADVSL